MARPASTHLKARAWSARSTPAGVLADLRTLTTLPNDIFIEGLGEVAKSGFIMDPQILRILEDHAAELRAFNGETLWARLWRTWSVSSSSAPSV